MDLIYTDANAVDQGVLNAYDFDLSYGAAENDFELVLDANDTALEFGSSIYMEGTEYGGIIDNIKSNTSAEEVTYSGRTWHGILNSKVIEPDSGEDYLVLSGDANAVLASLINRLGLGSLFKVVSTTSGIVISGYKMHRYIKGYDGICAMLAAHNAKLHIEWKDKAVHLSTVPVVDYTEAPIDGDIASLTVEQKAHKVNHLICLGKGNLAEREVIHLYADADGNIGDTQYYTGVDEVATTYENTNSEDLRGDGIKKFKELRDVDKAEIKIPESDSLTYDIGDIVGATENKSGVSVATAVTQKIVQISNGVVAVDYKTGEAVQQMSSGGGSGGGTGGGMDFNAIYPVGSIFLSVNATSPATLFGGTWERIQDTFLLAAGSKYAAGSTGGEAEHTLTADETPKVTGRLQFRISNNLNIVAGYPNVNKDGCFTYTQAGGATWNGQSGGGGDATRATDLITFDNGGQDEAHNNMPPYLAVYMWKRTA